MNNKFIEFLKSQISDRSLGQIEIATGVTKSYLSKLLRGERDIPKPETLKKLSKALPCSYGELMSVAGYTEGHVNNIVKIPVYGTIPAGIPTEMIDTSFIEDYEEINESLLKGGAEYFGLKVKGDSMFPEFRDGDTLIIKKQDSCENGDFCAVSINHTESTFKKVLLKENGITLQPLNPTFEPMFFTNQEVAELPITILGVVKEVRRSY